MQNRVDELVDDIIAYVEYLRGMGLQVTVHHLEREIHQSFHRILQFNVHEGPVCAYLKRNPQIWEECIQRQNKVREKAKDGAYFGTCWAGMGEFIFPIRRADQSVAGFLSVGGYAGDPQKKERQHEKICARYGVNRAELERIYERYARKERPDFDQLKVIIEPLCHQFSLLIIYLQEEEEIRLKQDRSNGEILFTAAKRYLERHYWEDIPITELAEHFNCSSGYLSRIIHEYAHCNYRKYVNTMKMHMARIYLSSTRLSIQEITHTLGFSDSNYFSTVFRRETGMSPRQWRQTNSQRQENPEQNA